MHVRDDDHIFGMRRFSLQHPKVRGYQGEALFLEYLRRQGLLAPRYFFVHVTINGNEAGIMAVEEHFGVQVPEGDEARPIFASVDSLAAHIAAHISVQTA